MQTVQTDYDLDTTILLMKTAFERTSGIKTYTQQGRRVTGKTGASLGSYGETIIAETQPTDGDGGECTITISGEKDVSMNITANPDKYVRRYMNQLLELHGRPEDNIVSIAEQTVEQGGSREVVDKSQQADGSWLMLVVVVGTFLLMMLMFASI